jgi:hypothetical protein
MKKSIITIFFLITATPALAQPAPAGKCSLIDNGVAQVGPTMRENGLHALSMPLPKDIGDAVADVSFRIEDDGTVSDVKLLCVSSERQAAAIARTAKSWRFMPVLREGKAVTANVTYRVSAAGAIPLSFLPSVLRKIEG